MSDEAKRDKAIQLLKQEMDEAVKAKRTILGIRLNMTTLANLFDNDFDIIAQCSVKPIGEDGWPLGAVVALGGSYGPDSYIYVDNALSDNELDIDYAK